MYRGLLLVSVGWIALTAVVWADSGRLLQEARQYIEKGDRRAAVIQLKNYLREQPDDGQARLLLGKTYLQLGNYPAAVKELERARDLGMAGWRRPLAEAYLKNGEPRKVLDNISADQAQTPADKAALLAMTGTARLMLGDLDEGKKALEQSLRLDPDDSTAHLGLARLALHDKDAETASSHLSRVIETDPENTDAYLLQAEILRQKNDFAQAVRFYEEVLKRRPRALPALLGSAAAYLAQGELDRSRKALDKVDGIAKDHPQALYLRGLLEFRAQNLDAAKAALEQVLYKVPDHPQSQILLGIIAYRQNDMKTAEKYLEEGYRQTPDSFPVAKLLAAVKMKLNRPREAVSLLEPYKREHAGDVQYLALLGSAYLQNRQYDEGTEALTEASRLAPEVAAIRTQLALGELASGDLAKAEGQLEKAVDLKQGVVQADVLLVLAQIKQKKYQQALNTAKKLAEKMPGNPMPMNLVASTHLAMGDKGEAERIWKRLLQDHPEYLTAVLNLAKLKFQQGKWEEAEKYYRGVLEKQPGHVTALVGLAQVAEARKEYGQMVGYLQRALDRHPDAIGPATSLVRYFLASGEAMKALSIARELVEYHEQNPVVYQLLGQAQLAAEQPASAAATFRKLTSLRPDNPMAWHLLALALEKNDDESKALEAWNEALRLQENFIPAATNRVRLLVKQKRYDEALEGAGKIQARNPDLAAGYYLEGEIHLARGEFRQALESYRKSHQITPSRATAQRLYQLYRQAGQADKGRAILESWLEQSPDDVGSLMMLAMGYQAAKENGKAISTYEKALSLQPDNVVILNNLAWLYQETGDARALATVERLAALEQGKPELLDTVGWVYLQNGRLKEGLRILQEAAVKAPHLPEIRLHLAEALSKTGRRDEAERELKRLIDEYPDFPQRQRTRKLLDSVMR